MYDTIFYALICLVIPLGCFFLFGWAILYHLLKYGFHRRPSRRIAFIFALVLVALSISVVQKFWAVDWRKVNLDDFMTKSHLNLSTKTYGR